MHISVLLCPSNSVKDCGRGCQTKSVHKLHFDAAAIERDHANLRRGLSMDGGGHAIGIQIVRHSSGKAAAVHRIQQHVQKLILAVLASLPFPLKSH